MIKPPLRNLAFSHCGPLYHKNLPLATIFFAGGPCSPIDTPPQGPD